MTKFNPSRLRFIELRGDGSKLPAKSWGGYSQDFESADRVYTHADIEKHPNDNWGVVDVEDKEVANFALLIFDIDIHKAPDDFDASRVSVPSDTLVTRSQNGGFHVYFALPNHKRGDLNESDFQMTDDPGFDVDIRGSVVSHHVVAPTEIPGSNSAYEVVKDKPILDDLTLSPGEAARRIQLDDEPLLEFRPDGDGGVDFDFDVPEDPPDEMPTCYHAGLELRKAAPDDHPNTHKVNVLTAACGIAAGFAPETVAEHFCGDWAPHDGETSLADREQTEYQVKHIADGGYSPPSESTLRDYGILSDNEHCDGDCPIDYHGPRSSGPSLDVLDDERGGLEEAQATAADDGQEADGGATTDSPAPEIDPFLDDVTAAIAATQREDDPIPAKTARHRIATAFVKHHDFVYPEDEVRGWRSTLYVFNDDEGVYEPRGRRFVERELEHGAGDWVTNNTVEEIIGKIKRMSSERGGAFETPPERLVVGNGILDLHTGELDPYNADEYHRTKIDVDWNPDAGEPDEIDDYLHEIVDDGDVPTLYRLIAHTLYKEYVTEKAAMLIGSGQNGKSVFLDVVEQFLGQFNVTHRELQEFEEQFKANALEGKLANVHPDMGAEDVTDMSMFKKLTGRDTMLADVKYEKPIQFENHATLIFAANELPEFAEDNHAVWRRWLYIDFPYTFDADDDDAKDPVPKRVLMREIANDEELEALLLRCQQEIEEWWGGRGWYPDAMGTEELRQKMKKGAEPVYNFATACLEPGDDEWVEKDVVRRAYRSYAEDEGLANFGDEEFGDKLLGLTDYQIESTRPREDGRRITAYEGVKLTSRGRQAAGLDTADDDQSTVDEADDPRKVIVETLKELVKANDTEPVEPGMVIGRASSKMGMATAERTLKKLRDETDGVIIELPDGKIIDAN